MVDDPEGIDRQYEAHRDLLVAKMTAALGADEFLAELEGRSESHRHLLHNSWLCVLVWAYRQALHQSLHGNREAVEATIGTVLLGSVTEREWFDVDLCESIQPHVDAAMPQAWSSGGGPRGLGPYPVADWLAAVEQSGHSVFANGYTPGYAFGIYFALFIPGLITEVRELTNRTLLA